jgi:hypothetical protein
VGRKTGVQGVAKFKQMVLTACALAVSGPLAAADEARTPIAPTVTVPAREKLVCQRIEEVGSRAYKKVWQTETQWRAQQKREKRGGDDRDRSDR